MASDPLAALARQIAEAAEIPPPQPYVQSDDPLARLQALMRGEAANDDRPPAPTAVAAVSGDGGLEALVGREVLAMVASQPLAADAREEAVRRLAVALANPSPDNVRAVLRVLVTGRTDA